VLLILLAVAAVLVQGALHREQAVQAEAVEAEPEPPPTIPAPALRPDLPKTPLSYVSDYWGQLARSAARRLVNVTEEGYPAVVVRPGLAVSSFRAAIAASTEEAVRRLERQNSQAGAPLASSPAAAPGAGTGDAREPAASLLGMDADLGLALFSIEESASPAFPPGPSAPLTPGMQIAAVSKNAAGAAQFAPGHIVAVSPPPAAAASGTPQPAEAPDRSFEVSLQFHKPPAAAAVVDLDGALLGLAVGDGGEMRLISGDRLSQAVERMHRGEPCVSIEVHDLDRIARETLGVDAGAAVERVRAEAFYPEPSIREGDVLLRWAEETVQSAGRFRRLYAAQRPGELVHYEVLRQGRRVRGGTIMPGRDCRPADELLLLSGLGLTLKRLRPGPEAGGSASWEALSVHSGGPAAAAGLRKGDRILAVNGAPLDEEKAGARLEELDQESSPIALTIHRKERTRIITLHRGAQ